MITTIQISENLKLQLKSYKTYELRTYEDVIKDLINKAKNCNKDKEKFLKEGYIAMYKKSLEITKEFEEIDNDEALKVEW